MSKNIGTYYGVEIEGDIAYTEVVDRRSETAYGKQRNDFEGTKESCIEYIEKKGATEVVGALKEIK